MLWLRIQTRLAMIWLVPNLFDDPDAVALVIWIAAGKVAVREQLARDVTAGEPKFFPVAHIERREVRWSIWKM